MRNLILRLWFVERRIEKVFRSDIGMWEETLRFGPFTSYRYSIWKEGNLWSQTVRKKKRGAIYLRVNELPHPVIGGKELRDEYGGNKWLVPINRVYDPKMP